MLKLQTSHSQSHERFVFKQIEFHYDFENFILFWTSNAVIKS